MPSIGNPLLVDSVVLGSLATPGRATVVGAGSPRDWDVRKGYGLSGAFVVYTGESLKPFDVIVDLWEDRHWIEWEVFSKVLEKPRPGVRPVALGIYHPAISRPPLSITEVVVLDVSQFEQVDDGLWSCRITLLPFKKPLPALGKPVAAIPAVAKPAPTAVDAAEIEMQRIQAEIAKKQAELARFKPPS